MEYTATFFHADVSGMVTDLWSEVVAAPDLDRYKLRAARLIAGSEKITRPGFRPSGLRIVDASSGEIVCLVGADLAANTDP